MSNVSSRFLGYDDKIAIGKRLRQLSELIDRDARRLYQTQNIEFEQRWFGVLNQLVLNGPMSVGELSVALGITHTSVSQTRKSLEEKNMISAIVDAKDSRKRLLTLTPLGKKFMDRMEPVFHVLEEASFELNQETGDIIAGLDRLHTALAQESLFERAHKKLNLNMQGGVKTS